MAHRNARLNVRGRLLLVERIEGGMPVADAAEMGGISRRCAYSGGGGGRKKAWLVWRTGRRVHGLPRVGPARKRSGW